MGKNKRNYRFIKMINRQFEMLQIENELNERLTEIIGNESYRIYDDFYVLHTGNIDSGNIVYSMIPLKSEWYHCKKDNIHFGYPLGDEKYAEFKNACRMAGFDPEKDFMYVNAIPFIPKGFGSFDKKTKEDLEWIGYRIFEKLQPRFIIIIGFETAEHLLGISYVEFLDNLTKPFDIESGAKVVLFKEHNFNLLSKLYYKNYHIKKGSS